MIDIFNKKAMEMQKEEICYLKNKLERERELYSENEKGYLADIKYLKTQNEIIIKECNKAEKHNREYLKLLKTAERNTEIRESIIKAKETVLKDKEFENKKLKEQIKKQNDTENKLKESLAEALKGKQEAEKQAKSDRFYKDYLLKEIKAGKQIIPL